MCISDLNPQMQFENLNMSSKTISPIRKQNKPTARVNEPVTHHLAATIRPTKEVNYWTTPYSTPYSSWDTLLISSTHATSSSHTTITHTTEITTTTTQELGVTRSYEKYHNEPIRRFEYGLIQSQFRDYSRQIFLFLKNF